MLSNENRQDGSICQCVSAVWVQSRSPRATVPLLKLHVYVDVN